MERYPIKTTDNSHRVIDGEAILVNFQDSFFYHLDSVGTFIWEHCDGRHTLAQIAARLVEEYDVTLEKALQDCRNFMERLVEQGLVQWRLGPDGSR